MKPSRALLLFPTGVCLMLICSACQSVPYSNRSQLMLTSRSYENEQGAQAWREILRTEKLSANPSAVNALNRVGPRIAQVSEQKNFNWEFKVIESKQANAFCLPGGKVALYTGILPYMENDAEMAVVIGHEVSHAIARHGGERMSQGYLQTAGAVAVSVATSDSQYGGLARSAYGITTNLGAILPYSRLHETEADKIGMILMAKAGYDPNYAISFWKKFGSESGSFLQAFTSTHPLGADRVREMQKNLPEALQYYQKAPIKYGAGQPLSKSSR